jgi:hypothetical protein
MATRLLLAVFIVLTLVCGGIAIYYNRVFEGLQVALAETKTQLAAAQARLKEQQSEPPHGPRSTPTPPLDPKGLR